MSLRKRFSPFRAAPQCWESEGRLRRNSLVVASSTARKAFSFFTVNVRRARLDRKHCAAAMTPGAPWLRNVEGP